jgi:hypothetical protein
MLRKGASIAFTHGIVCALVLLTEQSGLLLSCENMSGQLSFFGVVDILLFLCVSNSSCLYYSFLVFFIFFVILAKVKGISLSFDILLT